MRKRVFGIRRAVDRLRSVIPSGETAENFWNAEFSDLQRRAVDYFWTFTGEQAKEECAALRREVFTVAQNPTYSEQLTAINVLWYAPFHLAQNPEHPCQWSILSQLWVDGRLGQEERCTTLHLIFLQISRNPHHPHQWDAIRKLCDVWYVRREQGRLDLELAQDPAHPQRWLACHELWDFGGQRGREEGIVVRLLQEAANNFDDTHFQWQAITRLWYAGGGQQTQHRESVRSFIMQIVGENEHPYQRDALNLLLTSQETNEQHCKCI